MNFVHVSVDGLYGLNNCECSL